MATEYSMGQNLPLRVEETKKRVAGILTEIPGLASDTTQAGKLYDAALDLCRVGEFNQAFEDVFAKRLWGGAKFHSVRTLKTGEREVDVITEILKLDSGRDALTPANKGIFQTQVALLHSYAGRVGQAETYFELAKNSLLVGQDHESLANLHRQLAFHHDRKGDLDGAVANIDLAVADADRAVDDPNKLMRFDVGWLRGAGCRGTQAELMFKLVKQMISEGQTVSERQVQEISAAYEAARDRTPPEHRGHALPAYQHADFVLWNAARTNSATLYEKAREMGLESIAADTLCDNGPFNIGSGHLIAARACAGLMDFRPASEHLLIATGLLSNVTRPGVDKEIHKAAQAVEDLATRIAKG